MTYTENVRLALQAIKSNRLRTMLTALIIAIGLSALVGILTTLDAVKKSMTEAFSNMGANSFNIRNRGSGIRIGGPCEGPKPFKSIRFEDAMAFKKRLVAPATVTVSEVFKQRLCHGITFGDLKIIWFPDLDLTDIPKL